MFRGKKVIGLGLGQGDTGCQETLDVDVNRSSFDDHVNIFVVS